MTIHEDLLFTFELEEKSGILRFLWTDRTANMTDEDFKRTLLLYADYALKHGTGSLLVDVRNFHHTPGAEVVKWRNEVLVPRYEAAGIRKFAYVIGNKVPMPPQQSAAEGRKPAFETRYFRAQEEAEQWLASKPTATRFVMASYRLKPGILGEAKAAIQEYVERVQRTEAGTFSYHCLQSDVEPTRFIHLMSFADEEAEEAHAASPFMKEFSEKLFPYCFEGPNYETLRLVSSHLSQS